MSETTLRRIEGRAMIAVRADFADKAAAAALKRATGLAPPKPLRVAWSGATSVAWMAPDEMLVFVPEEGREAMLGALEGGFADQHALVADMSDARSIFRVEGPGARAVLSRLTPADMAPAAFGAGDFRRTRLAQVPCGLWMRDDGAVGVMCFRSVAGYVGDLLNNACAAETGG